MNTHEHRSCCRWQINWQAKIRCTDKDSFEDCHIADINFKGLKIYLSEKLPQDTSISLNLMLSSGLVLTLEAWVVWHKTIEGLNCYGLYFTRITDSDKEKIYQFMRSNFPKQMDRQMWGDLKPEKGGEPMEDRRIFARFPAKFSLRSLDLKQNKEIQAQVCDISAKGIGVVTKEQLQPHTPMEIWLEIPDKGEPLYSRGELVWLKQEGMDEYRGGINLERANLLGLSRILRAI